ncbi:hypothetical protein [Streptomyces sp. NBC_00878]|uniref:hypothetical protein n=1 Tax=Streptomyces sp. NBC_00878 TaxID=2975854 RepID=UPI002253EF09|nr:hypothetical protein [Streptomyces sp. NBC_00878]MCX4911185.1 hypothetical protein [Streptomyces sp. NBC_00878]
MAKFSLRPRLPLVPAVLLLSAVLTGCGSGGGGGSDTGDAADKGDVASIDKSGSGTAAGKKSGAASSDAGRPQWRLDSSSEEVTALWSRYYSCLKEHGVRFVPANEAQHTGPAGTGEVIADPDSREPRAAYDTCQIKMPLIPDELDPDKNPKYKEQLAASVACMNDKGVGTVVAANGVDWNYTGESSLTEAQTRKIVDDCELEAFSGRS